MGHGRVSKFNWERSGPPRPGAGAVAHPPAIERPYVHVTAEQKRLRREEVAAENAARGLAIRAAEWEARHGKPYPLLMLKDR
jgi:hypothetical protein